jgi:sugar phosphate isomerase/epimerase
MKVSIREGMIPRETLQDKLAWLESVGLDAVELHTGTLLLPAAEIQEAFAASPISISAIEGIPRLLSTDPAEREAAKQTIRERLALAGALGAVGVLVVPQFGRVPALPDLSPLTTGAELERNLLLAQLRELAPAARTAGVSLFLEPLNRYEAYIVNRVEQGAAIAAEAGPRSVSWRTSSTWGSKRSISRPAFAPIGSTWSTSMSPTATACSPGAATSISALASAL